MVNFEQSSGSPMELVKSWERNPFVENCVLISNYGPVGRFTTSICREDILQERWQCHWCSQGIETSLQFRTSCTRSIILCYQGMGWDFWGDEFSSNKETTTRLTISINLRKQWSCLSVNQKESTAICKETHSSIESKHKFQGFEELISTV